MDFGLGLVLSFTDNATQGINSAVSSLYHLCNMTEQTADQINRLTQITSLNTLSQVTGQLGNTLYSAGSAITGVFTKLLNNVMNTGSEFETFRVTLNALYKDTEEVDKVINKLMSFSATTPFEVDDVKDMIVVLKSQGLDAFKQMGSSLSDTRQETLAWLGDLMAFKPDIPASRWRLAFTNFLGSGQPKVLENVLDMGKIKTILGREIGETPAERLQDLIDLISSKDLDGLMSSMMGTWNQVLSNMSDTFTQFTLSIANAGVFNDLKEALTGITTAIAEIGEKGLLENVASLIADSLSIITKPLVALGKAIGDFIRWITKLVTTQPKLAKFVIQLTAFAGILLTLTGVAFKVMSSLSGIATVFLLMGGSFSSITSALFGGLKAIAAKLAPLLLLIGALYAIWKTDFGGIRTLISSFVSNVVTSFDTARNAVNMSVGDMMNKVTELQNSGGFWDNITVGIMKLMIVCRALSELWNSKDGMTLSEDTFLKAKELGVLPLIEAILDLKYRFGIFKKGFVAGFTAVSNSVKNFLSGLSDRFEGTFIDTLITKITTFFKLLSSGDADAWYKFGESFGKYTARALLFFVAFKALDSIIAKVIAVSKLFSGLGKIFNGLSKINLFGRLFPQLAKIRVSLQLLGQTEVIPRLTKMANKFSAAIPKLFSRLAGGATKFGTSSSTALATMSQTGSSAFTSLSGAGKAAMTALGGVSAPVLAAIAVAIASIATYAVTHWEEFKTKVLKIWTTIKDEAGKIWGAVKDGFLSIWNNLKEAVSSVGEHFSEFWGKLTSLFNTVKQSETFQVLVDILSELGKILVDVLVPALQGIIRILSTTFISAWNVVVATINSVVNFIAGVLNGAMDIIGGILDIIVGIFTLDFDRIWDGVKSVFGGIFEIISTTLSSVWNIISSVFKGIFNIISSILSAVWEVIKGTFMSIFETIGNVLGWIWDKITSVFSSIFGSSSDSANGIKDAVCGAFTSMKEKIESVWNGIVSFLQPVIDLVTDLFNTSKESIMSAWNSTVEFFSGIWNGIVEVFNGAKDKITEFIDNISAGIQSMKDKIMSYVQPAIDTFNEVKATVGEFVTFIKDKLTSLWENSVQPIFSKIQAFIVAVVTPIVSFIVGSFNYIKNIISGVMNTIWTIIQTVWNTIWNFISPIISLIWNNITTVFTGIYQTILGVLTGVWNIIKGVFTSIFNTIVNILSGIWNTIVGVFNSIVDFIGSILGGIWGTISNVFMGILNFIMGKNEEAKSNFSKAWESIKSIFSGALNAIWNFVKSIFGGIWNTIKSIFNGIWNTIKSIWNGIVSVFTNAGKSVVNTVKNLFGNIRDTFTKITDKISDTKDKIKSAIDKIKGFFNFKWEFPKLKMPHFEITGKFSLNPPSVPKFGVNWYETGGIFNKPSVIGVGENGKEAVMPLENNTGWIGQLATKIGALINKKNAVSSINLTGIASVLQNVVSKIASTMSPVVLSPDTDTKPQNVVTSTPTPISNNNTNQNTRNNYLTTNNNQKTNSSNIDNSVTFEKGSIVVQANGVSESEAEKFAELIIEKIRRKNQINNMIHYKNINSPEYT